MLAFIYVKVDNDFHVNPKFISLSFIAASIYITSALLTALNGYLFYNVGDDLWGGFWLSQYSGAHVGTIILISVLFYLCVSFLNPLRAFLTTMLYALTTVSVDILCFHVFTGSPLGLFNSPADNIMLFYTAIVVALFIFKRYWVGYGPFIMSTAYLCYDIGRYVMVPISNSHTVFTSQLDFVGYLIAFAGFASVPVLVWRRRVESA
jgi:hypothetical protein